MNETRLLETWYGKFNSDGKNRSSSVAQQAYEAAVDRFCSVLSHDDRKKLLAQEANSIDGIRDALNSCHVLYSDKRRGQKARKWIIRLTSKIQHYGNVLDVFVQHHPEYTSLVWGAFKLLLVGAQNHEATFALLAKALAQIADALPRLELYTVLYPTDRMRSALEDLYAYLIKFFIRAFDWFQENPFQHILHSITRPPELRYKDLLDEIDCHSRRLDQLATSGSQAEVRAIHIEIADTRTTVMEMKKMMAEFQAINSSAAIDTNQRVTDIQFSNIVSSVSSSPLGDYMKTYQHLMLLAKRGKQAERQSISSLCSSRTLMAWSSSAVSQVAAIKGSFSNRLAMRYFCVAIVEQLQQSGITILWALKNTANHDNPSNETQISSVDILKHLTLQALKAGRAFTHEKPLSLTCSRFHTATTGEEWFQIFESVVTQLSGPVFIIIDLQVLHTASLEAENFNWTNALLSFLESTSQRGIRTIFKLLLFGYGPAVSSQTAGLQVANTTVKMKPARGLKHKNTPKRRVDPVKIRQSWLKKT